MDRIICSGIVAFVVVGATSCSDASLGSADTGPSTDSGVGDASDTGASDTKIDSGAGDTAIPGGKWTTVSTSGTTPMGAGNLLAIGLPTKAVMLQDRGASTQSATFDGSVWSAVTVPTGLKGTGCGGAVGFAGGALVYSGCQYFAPDIYQTWVFDGSSWSAKTAGGQGRGYAAMARANDPNKVFMTGGVKPSGTGKLDWLASWTLAGGWQAEPAPSTLLGTKGFPDETFTIFNLGDTAYAIDSTGKTRKWDGADWAEVVGAGPAPKSSSWVSRSVATDGKQTLLQLQLATHAWDGKSWTLISEDPACDGGRTPTAVANIGSRFFLFCLPTAGDTTPWQVQEWK